jgi:glycosyltransferase involved in cell wall biosynthesis
MIKKVTVIIPTRNESAYITQTLDSVFMQDYPSDYVEIMVADGNSQDNTRDVLEALAANHPNLKIISNPNRTVPYALNNAIAEATGDVIIRMDSHSNYPENYISRLISEMDRLNSDNIGGVCITMPANDGLVATAIALAISHPMGIGNSSFRLKNKRIKTVDTVPFGCFRKSLFDKIGLFDTDLVRNQDDEFNGRIIKNGGKIYLLPDLEIRYFAREKIKGMSRMFYQYGLFKPLVNQKLGAPTSIRQLVPPLFTLFMFLGITMPFQSTVIVQTWFLIFFLYLTIAIAVSFSLALRNRRLSLFPILIGLFPIIHLSYGLGYLKGFILVFILRKKPGDQTIAISR